MSENDEARMLVAEIIRNALENEGSIDTTDMVINVSYNDHSMICKCEEKKFQISIMDVEEEE